MKDKALSALKYSILLAVGVSLFLLAFKGVSLFTIYNSILHADASWIILSVFFSLLAHISRAYRWNLLIEPLGYQPKLKNTFAAVMIGYLANLAIPRMGEVTRCGTLNQSEKVPFDGLLGTVISERIIDLLSLLICILLTTIFQFKLLGGFLYSRVLSPVITPLKNIFSSPLKLTVIAILLITLILLFVKFKPGKGKSAGKIQKLVLGLKAGLLSVLKMKQKKLFLFHSVFIWLMYFMSTYVCFFALGPTSDLTASAGLFALVAGSIGMTAPVQGGIGIYHILVSQGLLLFGVSASDGLIFATIVHGTQTLLVIVIGGISLFYISFRKKYDVKTGTDQK